MRGYYTCFGFYMSFLILYSNNSLSSQETVVLQGSSNQKKMLVSPRDVFEMGFFQPNLTVGRWYLGIWFREDPMKTSVWVANRDRHIDGPNGTLILSNNELVLLDQDDTSVWSANLSGAGVRSEIGTELLDNGNFVVKDSNGYLWQSFDSPTDTLLPQMKLGVGKALISWARPDDPASGFNSFELKNQAGLFAIYFSLGDDRATVNYRSDPWDGIRFGDLSEILQLDYISSNRGGKAEDSNFAVVMTGQNNLRRFRIGETLEIFTWVPESTQWKLLWSLDLFYCNAYNYCGSYGYCSRYTTTACNCIKGFEPKSKDQWAFGSHRDGCRRRTRLSCGGDSFLPLKNMKLPDANNASVRMDIGFEECQTLCLSECNCTAFAHVDVRKGFRGCVIWTGDLKDLQDYNVTGQDLHVRLAASDIEKAGETSRNKEKAEETSRNKSSTPLVIGLIVGSVLLLILCFCLGLGIYYWKRMQIEASATQGPSDTELMLTEMGGEDRFTHMELGAIVEATGNFSEANILGRGGFGVVYKGILANGTVVAVKKLSERSSQGAEEFRNEVRTVLNVMHRNLVRLQGCCCEGTEKILVYEYLENSSLNRYIFDEARSGLLNWEKRFRIIREITQGLSYLHNYTASPIIHRDLKPSNILLDQNMTPKISDFGMARILDVGMTETATQRVSGTYGYMSEEYALSNVMSEKSDIFSLGVMILEIITGQQNSRFCTAHPGQSLLGLAWSTWKEGNGLQLVDSRFQDATLQEEEVLRCIQIGLCCVQDEAAIRPSTGTLVLMLTSPAIVVPEPIQPDYYYARFLGEGVGAASSSSPIPDIDSTTIPTKSASVNQITISGVGPR